MACLTWPVKNRGKTAYSECNEAPQCIAKNQCLRREIQHSPSPLLSYPSMQVLFNIQPISPPTLGKDDAVMPCYSVYSQNLAVANVNSYSRRKCAFLDVGLLPTHNMAPISDRKV